MFKWLTIQDISGAFKITENAPQKDIDRAVNEAYEFDILPVLSDAMMNAIKSLLSANIKQWNKSTAYSVNDVIFYGESYYKAVTGSTGEMPPNVTYWAEHELLNFWSYYVKKYFGACAYYRLMLWHGVNVTQYGLVTPTEETSVGISDKVRGDIMADIRNKRDLYLIRLNKAFNDANLTFDGVKYAIDNCDNNKPTQGINIFPVGNNRAKKLGRSKNCCDDNYLML